MRIAPELQELIFEHFYLEKKIRQSTWICRLRFRPAPTDENTKKSTNPTFEKFKRFVSCSNCSLCYSRALKNSKIISFLRNTEKKTKILTNRRGFAAYVSEPHHHPHHHHQKADDDVGFWMILYHQGLRFPEAVSESDVNE